MSILAQQQVGGFDVAMDDVLVMHLKHWLVFLVTNF